MNSPTPPPPFISAAPASAGAPPPVAPWHRRIRAYRLLWTVGIALFVADQITKIWIHATMPLGTYGAPPAITVIPGFAYFVHVGNTGAAWSMFSGQSVALALLAALTLVAIFFWRRALGLRDRTLQVSFGLLCGGITGNLVDRLMHKHVIDFIDLHFGSYTYPTFNVADCGICIGVVLYLWHSLRTPN